MSKINARSPYYINVASTNLTNAKLELYVYTGTQTTNRPFVTYTIDTVAIDEEVTFEISELVKDYILNEFNGTYSCFNVWVDYQITESILDVEQSASSFVQLEGFDGYGNHEDGANPQNDSTDLLQSNTIMYVIDGGVVTVPVDQGLVVDVKFYKDAALVSTTTIIPTSSNTGQVVYANESDVTSVDVYDGLTTTTIAVENINECKYTPYKVTFVNKFGVFQDLYFFKRSDINLSVTGESFKRNNVTSGSYNISKHQTTNLNKTGSKSITLNSGFVDETFNEVLEQLLLSEKVWITYNSNVLPINLKTSTLKYQTRLNDKLINYTIDADFAFNSINNVR